MQRSGILIMLVVFLLALASTAAAQAPGQAEPMSAQFLEQRVNDELESEGVVLSNHNLGLKVEQLADKWLVALVELTTGRVADSTRIDQLPADREAAVAVITNVVETLEAQVLGRRERPEPQPPQAAQPPPVVPPPSPPPAEGPAERLQRQSAELSFERQSLRFGAIYDFSDQHGILDVHRRWVAFRGDPSTTLEPREFYRVLGRDDLARAYGLRRAAMIGSYVVGGVALVVSGLLTISAVEGGSVCDLFTLGDRCVDIGSPLGPLVFSVGVSVAGIVMGYHFYRNPHPIDENDARTLADAYNQRLRGKLGLPVGIRRPLTRDLTLTPYVAGWDSGLVLRGRF